VRRRQTAQPHTTPLVAGHFREGKGYAVWRSRDTKERLLIDTISGLGRFGHASGEIIAKAGDLVLLRPGTLHDYGVEPSLSRWELLWAHFHPRPHWLDLLNWPAEAEGLHRLRLPRSADARRIRVRFADVHRWSTAAHPHAMDLAINALEEVLLLCDAHNPLHAESRGDPRVRAAIEFISANFHRPINLDEIAEAAGLSVSRLSHLFRAHAGTTPQQFVEAQRMNRARQLLEFTPRSIKEIARDVGFDNPFYFTLRFRRHTGRSPRAYRNSLVR
jgi:AraC family transcriptional regulator of arabinose operon